jgi:hypothetical protein
MASASWSLQRAIYDTLANDGDVVQRLGGARIFDDVPQKSPYPYLTLGQSVVRDWSTGTEEGAEHILTLHVWSRAEGRREAHDIMTSIREALHDRALALDGHRLVQLRHELSEARREPDGETYHGIVRLRATTEPL